MSFRAEILKSGDWIGLDWVQGSAPIVSKSIETQYQIFSFQSSNVQFKIFDTAELFRPGGGSEIVPGDAIKVYHSGILVFSGAVDTVIHWNPIDGILTFAVTGWLGQINQLFAGRATLFAVGSDFRYRYRKTEVEDYFENGEDVPVEYLAYPSAYETIWRHDLRARMGYEKEWLFDSRALNPESVFRNESLLYDEVGTGGAEGLVWKRPESRGYLYEVSFSDLVTELIKQIKYGKNDHDYSAGNVDFDTITTNFPIAIALDEETTYDVAIFMSQDDNVFCISFKNLLGQVYHYGYRSVNLFRIRSKVDLEDKVEFEFPGQVWAWGRAKYPTEWIDLRTAGYGNQGNIFTISIGWTNLNFNSQRARVLDDGRILVWQLWTWYNLTTTNLHQSIWGQEHGHCEFFIIDSAAGSVSDIGSITRRIGDGFFSPEGDQFKYHDGNFEQILAIVRDHVIANLSKSVIFPNELPARGENFTSITFSTETDEQPVNVTANGGLYALSNGVLSFQGTLELDSAGFDFRNARIVDVLLEMAKLTNSLFYLDDNKQLHFVKRSYFNTIDIRDLESVTRVTSSVKSHSGSSLPVISSQIVQNKSYNKALNDYYLDTYFPEEITLYQISCMDTASNIAIQLLDRIQFDYQGSTTVGIVQSFEIREGLMNILARAA